MSRLGESLMYLWRIFRRAPFRESYDKKYAPGLLIPPHSIWCIVDGTATDADIAQAIYRKRSAGCGMKGIQSYNVTQLDSSEFEINWDEVTKRFNESK
jgi:hypothetical protein